MQTETTETGQAFDDALSRLAREIQGYYHLVFDEQPDAARRALVRRAVASAKNEIPVAFAEVVEEDGFDEALRCRVELRGCAYRLADCVLGKLDLLDRREARESR